MSETRRQLEEVSIRGVSQFSEPRMAAIPEGWFTMGCETAEMMNAPPIGVWVDRFALGIYQVTRAEIRRFSSRSTPGRSALLGGSQFSGAAAAGCRAVLVRCRGLLRVAEQNHRPKVSAPHGSGMGTRRVRRHRGPALQLGKSAARRIAGLRKPVENWPGTSWDSARRIHMGYSTWATTFTNGARTGMTRITTRAAPNVIPKGRNKVAGARREAERGGTTLKSPGARRDRASLRDLCMPIMASGWHSRSKGPSFAFFGPVRFFKPEGEPETPDENQTR